MAWVEVKDIDDTQCQSRWVDGAGGSRWGVPVLKLRVGFDREVVGEIVVEADSGGVNHRGRADVEDVLEEVAGLVVVDFAAADEEVDIGMEVSDWVLDFGAEEEVFLAADVALVDGIGAANLEGWPELAEVENGEVDAGGDVQVFSAFEVGEGAGACDKGGELKLLFPCGDRLCKCGVGQGADRNEEGQPCQFFCKLHSVPQTSSFL
jgi:hypothetical protein